MRKRPASSGARWIAGGWQLLKTRPGLVIGSVLLMYVLVFLVSMVPLIGMGAGYLIAPVLGGGVIMIFVRIAEILERSEEEPLAREQPIGFDLLFSQFRGEAPWRPLVGLGGVTILVNLLILLLLAGYLTAALPEGGMNALNDPDLSDGERLETLLPVLTSASALGVWLGVVVVYVLYLSAMLFAVPLVVLREYPLTAALAASFRAVWLNWLPMLVFGLIWLGLFMTIPLTAGLSAILLVPWAWAALYAAYVSIFPAEAPASDPEEDVVSD
ncbi:BPSS1780 family membrane protein [Guyparkeria sp.]|uniref:BPSS1780 family membrane protein n=1 Tax=Guyparkeria sp. TaxID=2035736 RepID=UPI003970CF17